jgi:hypothetical protein
MSSNRELGIEVIGLIDDAMGGLNQILSTLQEIPDQITTDININGDAGQEVTDLTTGVDNLNNTQLAIPVDTGSVTDLDSDAITAANDIEGMGSAAEDASSRIQSAMDEAGTSINNVGSDASGASSDTSNIGSDTSTADGIGTAVASVGIEAGIAAAINGAGNYEDSMRRIGTTQDHMVETSAQVSAKWGGTMSQMSSDTERSMGSIRGDVAVMGVVGVHSANTIKEGFDLMSGAAFNTKQPIESVETAYARVIATGTLGKKQLTSLGSSVEELQATTGLTPTQATAKMVGMNSEQKAAFLDTIMDTDKNRAGIEAYKGTWEQTLDATKNTGDYLSRVLGGTVLPAVTTALNGVNWALGGFVGLLDNLPQPIKGAVDGVIGMGIVFVGATAAVGGLSFALGKLPKLIQEAVGKLPLLKSLTEQSLLEQWLRGWYTVGQKVVDIAKNIGRDVGSIIRSWTDTWGPEGERAATGTFKDLESGAKDGEKTFIDGLKGFGGKVVDTIKGWVGWDEAINSKDIEMFDKGGKNFEMDSGGFIGKIKSFGARVVDTIKGIKFPKFNIFGDEKGTVNTDFIGDIIKSIKSKLPSLKSVSELIPKNIIDGITPKLPSIKGIGGKIPGEITDGIKAEIPKLLGKSGGPLIIVTSILQVLSGAGENWHKGILKSVKEAFGGDAWMGIMKAILPKDVKAVLASLWNVFKTPFKTAAQLTGLDKILQITPENFWGYIFGKDASKRFGDWLDTNVSGPINHWFLNLPARLYADAKNIALTPNKVWEYVFGSDAYKQFGDWLENNISTPIYNWFENLPGEILSWSSGIAGDMEKPFIDFGNWMQQLPGNMYNWAKAGIVALGQGIVDAVPGLSKILGAISSLFPKSPPKTGPLSEIKAENMRSWMKGIASAGMEGFGDFNLSDIGKLLNIPNSANAHSSSNSGPKEFHVTVDLSNVPANMPIKTAETIGVKAGTTAGDLLKGYVSNGGKPMVQLKRGLND